MSITKVRTRNCPKCKGEMYLGNDDWYYCTNCDYEIEKQYRRKQRPDTLGHIFRV